MRRIGQFLRVGCSLLLLLAAAFIVVAGGWLAGVQARVFAQPPEKRQQNRQANNKNNDDFESRLIQSLADELDDAGDIEREDRDTAMEILREADPLLSRIRKQNRAAMKRANNGPRAVPRQPKKKKAAGD